MAAVLLLLCWMADVEARLESYRNFPPLLRARASLNVATSAEIPPALARKIALESLDMAAGVPPTLELKRYPEAFRLMGSPDEIAARAWLVYHQNREQEADLPFPPRHRSSPAQCTDEAVDSAEVYLQAAATAGERELTEALTTLRSAPEIEQALKVLSTWRSPRAVDLAAQATRRLRGALDSRREYREVKDLDMLVRTAAAHADAEQAEAMEADLAYFHLHAKSLPQCPVPALPVDEPPTLDDLQGQLIREAGADDYSFLDLFLRWYQRASDEPARLDAMERSGNQRLAQLTATFRKMRTASPRR